LKYNSGRKNDLYFNAKRGIKQVFWEDLGIAVRLSPAWEYGEIEVFIDFFVLLYSAQSKTVRWNKRSGSTNRPLKNNKLSLCSQLLTKKPATKTR